MADKNKVYIKVYIMDCKGREVFKYNDGRS